MHRSIPFIALIATLLLNASAARAAEEVVTLSVPGLPCSLCPVTVAKALEKVPGVRDVSVDLDTKSARVRFDDEATSLEALTKVTTDAGYPSTPSAEQN